MNLKLSNGTPGSKSGSKSLSEDSVESCFRAKGRLARRDERAYPAAVCKRGATQPDGLSRENPPGGGSFVWGLCWLSPYSPLRGCSGFAALAATKIPCRTTPRNFQSGSKPPPSHSEFVAGLSFVILALLLVGCK